MDNHKHSDTCPCIQSLDRLHVNVNTLLASMEEMRERNIDKLVLLHTRRRDISNLEMSKLEKA